MNDLKLFTGQHQNSVGRVFKDMGIKSPVTPSNVLLQMILNPDFIDRVGDQIEADHYNLAGNSPISIDHYQRRGYTNWGGTVSTVNPADDPTGDLLKTKELSGVVVTAKGKSTQAKNTLGNILNLVAGGLGTYLGARKAAQGNNVSQGNNNGGGGGARQHADPITPAAQKKQTNLFLIGGIAAIIVLLLLITTKKKS